MGSLTENRRKKIASVRRIIDIWRAGGLNKLVIFLNDDETIIEKESWGSRIKQNIDENHYESVELELYLLSQKFKVSNNEFEKGINRQNEDDSSTGV